MLAATLFPAGLLWITLDRRTRAANAGVASIAPAPAAESNPFIASPRLEYFGAPPEAPMSVQYASVVRRMIAFVVDVLICYCVICVLFFVTTGDVSPSPGPSGMTLIFACELTVLGVCWLYWAIFEASSLQATPGKRMFTMRVTDANGQRITFTRATARFFAKIPSNLPLGMGLVFPLFTFKKQALHDIKAGTLVVRK